MFEDKQMKLTSFLANNSFINNAVMITDGEKGTNREKLIHTREIKRID